MKFQINGFDSQGKGLKVPVEVGFSDKTINEAGYSRLIRVLFNHLRQASSSTKDRGEVSFTNKKPWRQKGTGRARASSARSPLWRSGGVTFGPTPGCRRLKVNKKERKAALGQIVRNRLNDGDFVALELPEITQGKGACSQTGAFIKSLNFGCEKLLFILSSSDVDTFKRLKNLNNVDVAFFDQLGALDLSKKGKVAFLVKDKELMQEAFGKWI